MEPGPELKQIDLDKPFVLLKKVTPSRVAELGQAGRDVSDLAESADDLEDFVSGVVADIADPLEVLKVLAASLRTREAVWLGYACVMEALEAEAAKRAADSEATDREAVEGDAGGGRGGGGDAGGGAAVPVGATAGADAKAALEAELGQYGGPPGPLPAKPADPDAALDDLDPGMWPSVPGARPSRFFAAQEVISTPVTPANEMQQVYKLMQLHAEWSMNQDNFPSYDEFVQKMAEVRRNEPVIKKQIGMGYSDVVQWEHAVDGTMFDPPPEPEPFPDVAAAREAAFGDAAPPAEAALGPDASDPAVTGLAASVDDPSDVPRAMAAALQWVLEPSDDDARVARDAAARLDSAHPASLVAASAWWSAKNINESGAEPVPPPEGLAENHVIVAMTIAATMTDSDASPEAWYDRFVARAIRVAQGLDPWGDEAVTSFNDSPAWTGHPDFLREGDEPRR